MASKLYVGGLPYSTTSDELREAFAQCGTVVSATVVTDRFTGQSRGFAFVEMSTDAEAQAAISRYDGQDFGGRRLKVERSNPSDRPSGGRAVGAGGPRRQSRW